MMLTVLSRALAARCELVEAGAPERVIAAADMAIDCTVAGVSPPLWARDILFKYAQRGAEQSRYGKAMQ
jgi:hypothetical protein